MKMYRVALLVALLSAFTYRAQADDFQMIVVDPPNPGVYSVNPVLTTSFSLTLLPCQAGQVPANEVSTYIGCETFQNLTGYAITSLDISINAGVDGQTGTCADVGFPPPYNDEFPTSGISCTTQYDMNNKPDGYNLFFGDGSILDGARFTIAESGAPAADFPANMSVTATLAPEPGSMWLMSTGLLSCGALLKRRLRGGANKLS